MNLRYLELDFVDYGAGGQYVGVMEGQVTGERLNGALKVVNVPSKRPDDVNMPTLSGILTTQDGAKLFVEMNGIALPQGEQRHFLTTFMLRAGDERYRWVNVVFGVMEGVLSAEGVAVGHVFECVPTLAP